MKEICCKNECTGCTACVSVCSTNAIYMKTDDNGFLYPVIDESKCIDCKLCQKTCPMINCEILKSKFYKSQKAYLGKNQESIRIKSSSGGMFHAFASNILQHNGVVYGAGFKNDLSIVHKRVDKLDALDDLMASKYAQSTMNNTYQKVYQDLISGKQVYFSGCPCQVSGLIMFLDKKNCQMTNLITQDFVCHGVGSPKFLKDYLNEYEKKYKSKAVHVNFRGKPKPGKLQNMIIDFDNGKKFVAFSTNEDFYYYHFLNNLILRPSCFECKYSKIEHQSDITLGDCFLIKENDVIDDEKGMSYIQVNSDKGIELLEKLDSSIWVKEVDITKYVQPNMKKPTPKPSMYDLFWNTYITKGYYAATKEYGNRNFKHMIKRIIIRIVNDLGIVRIIKKIIRKK